jgi:hypothetical protein
LKRSYDTAVVDVATRRPRTAGTSLADRSDVR